LYQGRTPGRPEQFRKALAAALAAIAMM